MSARKVDHATSPIGLCLAGCGVIAIFCMAMVLPLTANACACGEYRGPVVARGESPHGVPWMIRAARERSGRPVRRYINVSFSVLGPFGFGGSTGLPLPLSKAFVLHGGPGEIDEPYPEGSFSGLAEWRVASVEMRMSDGSLVTILPTFAPQRFRERFPWLRGFRFFFTFYEAGIRPEVVTAFNRGGAVITRSRTFLGRTTLARKPRGRKRGWSSPGASQPGR